MTDNIRNQLAEEISKRFEELDGLELGSKEYREAVESIKALYETGTKELIADTEFTEKMNRLDEEIKLKEKELDLKTEELEERKKGRITGLIGDGVKLALPILVYIWAYCTGMEFEENHTFTNGWTRKLVDNVPFFKRK